MNIGMGIKFPCRALLVMGFISKSPFALPDLPNPEGKSATPFQSKYKIKAMKSALTVCFYGY
jgi:hypothetical protein